MPDKIEKTETEEVVEDKKEGETEAPESKSKTAEELKAEAEAVEAEIKAIQEEKKGDELASNQARRLEKAREKLNRLKAERQEVEDGESPADTKEDIKVRDLITLGKHDIAEGSEKAKILTKYKKGGIIKDFAEGLTHPGVQAEFAALDAKDKARSVINENDSDDAKLKTKQEVIANYKASGEVPEDPALRKEIADANLKEMGI